MGIQFGRAFVVLIELCHSCIESLNEGQISGFATGFLPYSVQPLQSQECIVEAWSRRWGECLLSVIRVLNVTIRTYRPIFIYYSVYGYWSHSDSRFIFLPASGPIVLDDLCAARCCDSELRFTVHYCALWPIVAVTLLFSWRLLFALLHCSFTVYKSGLLGTL